MSSKTLALLVLLGVACQERVPEPASSAPTNNEAASPAARPNRLAHAAVAPAAAAGRP
jgi:hypothetical protein